MMLRRNVFFLLCALCLIVRVKIHNEFSYKLFVFWGAFVNFFD